MSSTPGFDVQASRVQAIKKWREQAITKIWQKLLWMGICLTPAVILSVSYFNLAKDSLMMKDVTKALDEKDLHTLGEFLFVSGIMGTTFSNFAQPFYFLAFDMPKTLRSALQHQRERGLLTDVRSPKQKACSYLVSSGKYGTVVFSAVLNSLPTILATDEPALYAYPGFVLMVLMSSFSIDACFSRLGSFIKTGLISVSGDRFFSRGTTDQIQYKEDLQKKLVLLKKWLGKTENRQKFLEAILGSHPKDEEQALRTIVDVNQVLLQKLTQLKVFSSDGAEVEEASSCWSECKKYGVAVTKVLICGLILMYVVEQLPQTKQFLKEQVLLRLKISPKTAEGLSILFTLASVPAAASLRLDWGINKFFAGLNKVQTYWVEEIRPSPWSSGKRWGVTLGLGLATYAAVTSFVGAVTVARASMATVIPVREALIAAIIAAPPSAILMNATSLGILTVILARGLEYIHGLYKKTDDWGDKEEARRCFEAVEGLEQQLSGYSLEEIKKLRDACVSPSVRNPLESTEVQKPKSGALSPAVIVEIKSASRSKSRVSGELRVSLNALTPGHESLPLLPVGEPSIPQVTWTEWACSKVFGFYYGLDPLGAFNSIYKDIKLTDNGLSPILHV